ncbi:helix-turn-helix domain-containing protein [Nonomuraea sp. K274]|uniref:Helix-turn-helix domain-containing protein n=1 Tax=Nonomuraea cypriaca TaxID=1187855 RepID=A0A931F3R7_9ACTN|nr:helix-turn-helix transcriptional regulator [Nonomuraea cypriaca]MBF8194254.1 helix-turn-helix domain-containing protein [Nonomuraea cypriaca]
MDAASVTRRGPLADFLAARRALVSAADCGLPASGYPRRVPGLRREEVAQLAGISTDYYTRLEQGRVRTASTGVLHAIGRALRLNDDQQLHLVRLGQADSVGRGAQDGHSVSPQVLRLIDNIADTPAMVFNRFLDIMAWNRLGSALLGDLAAIEARHRNYARMIFLDPHSRALAVEWEKRAKQVVSSLRMTAGADPDQPRLRELVAELSARDPQFRTWWTEHVITTRPFGRCRLHHPAAGEFDTDWYALRGTDRPDQVIVLVSAASGSHGHTAIRTLDAWARELGLSGGVSRRPPPGPSPRATRGRLAG